LRSTFTGASRRGILLAGCAVITTACGGGGDAQSTSSTADASAQAVQAARDITADVLANRDVTLAGAAVIKLPAGTTTYTGVISGQGTLRLMPAAGTGTLTVTRTSTFTLPTAQQVQVIKKTIYPGAGYALTRTGLNPPVLTVDPGATLQIGTNTSADSSPNVIATSDSKNDAGLINREINLNNILNNGTIVLSSAQFGRLGRQLVGWRQYLLGRARSHRGAGFRQQPCRCIAGQCQGGPQRRLMAGLEPAGQRRHGDAEHL